MIRTLATATAVALLTLAALAAPGGQVAAEPLAPDDDARPGPFPYASLDGWSERRFAGSTDYALVEEDGVRTLRGHARGTASILYRERTVNLARTPVLEWSWKVDRVYPMIDERTRDGDDYPARLYVVARTGFLPWETLALNYVWSSSEAEPGASWANPFTDKAIMIPVRSGTVDVGRWTRQRRDVAADFRAAFGLETDEIDGYAVMVDGDNGGREARAWFGDIAFVPRDDERPAGGLAAVRR